MKTNFRNRFHLFLAGGACVLLSLAFMHWHPAMDVDGLEAAEGLEVTTFAAEPMLVNPTNMTVDEHGRVWIIEGVNYRPNSNQENVTRPEGDRIVILEDTDRDGQADKETVFYQSPDINSALGIAVLGDKVYVSAYENVFVFTDADGDDRPENRETLFTNVSRPQHDHGVHAFVFGPDGKLYFNFGNTGEQLQDAAGRTVIDKFGEEVVGDGTPYREGMAFRLNEDRSEVEVLAYNFRNNYELAVDAYGTIWQSDNDDDGNRSVRINYVMEYGNYGYQDELTGAGWRSPRVNMEESIQNRHWHQNDPGVVPNLLLTGAGSPAGILVYEGTLLPERFHGQIIHAEPGANVVRSYPVETAGAGYTATMLNVVQGARDPWFRPADVTVAPDGSLFIADWNDPGVGGHRAGDQAQGRVYRVAPPGVSYTVPTFDFNTIDGAIEALKNPNNSVQYLAWHRLHDAGAQAEPALRVVYEDRSADNARFRARALWLLTKIPGRGDYWVRQALADQDVNIRITGLRAARQLDTDVLPYVEIAARDASPQLRREAAIALRGNTDPRAAGLWADLALRHDGQDRWYLEALGIGAIGQWDRFFAAWQQKAGANWNTPAGRDVIWRSRAAAALPLLTQIIESPQTAAEDRPRYFRALAFHDSTQTQQLLRSLLALNHPQQAQIDALALYLLEADPANISPDVQQAINRALESARGTQAFVDLVQRFQLRDRAGDLVAMAMNDPESVTAQDAARLAISLANSNNAGGGGQGGGQGGGNNPAAQAEAAANIARLFGSALNSTDQAEVRKALVLLGYANNNAARTVLQEVMLDENRPMAVRTEAVRALGLSNGGENALLAMAREGTLPEALKPAAGGVLFASYSLARRVEAAQYLQPPQGTTVSGTPLPPPGELGLRQGDSAEGQVVFQALCSACHQVQGQGIAFGPDLSEIGSKLAKEALHTSILEPSAGINFGYEGFTLRLRDGTEAIGYIESETEQELALRAVGGITTRYNKADVAGRTPLALSLMPEGLEGAMTEKQLVDLVEYLASLRSSG
jgi:putative membrane-bound dehydrogenase-like protein